MSSRLTEVPADAIEALAQEVAEVSNDVLPSYTVVPADEQALRRGELLAETHCIVCHEVDGSADDDFIPLLDGPILNGQYPGYIEAAVQVYRLGVRQAPEMTEAVRALSPSQIADIAVYYGSLKGLRPY